MRSAYKPFFLGIFITSVLWGAVLYFFIPLDIHQFPALSSHIRYQSSKPQIQQQKKELSNFIDSEPFSADGKISGSYVKSINHHAKHNQIEDIGLIRNEGDKLTREKGYKKHAFNVLVSNRLDYHREIPDTRHEV